MNDALPLFDSLLFRLVLGLIIGGVLGSFGTMLAYRLPRGLSIIKPRSHCPACKTTLTPRDLVPVFSWLLSRGKCRHCGAAIGKQYVAIEIACATLCALATLALANAPLFLFLLYGVITVACSWAIPRYINALTR